MEHLTISLFGPFQVCLEGNEVTGFKSQRVRALLAYLAAEAGRVHSRDTLAALLWPNWPDQQARSNLRYAIYNLRQVLHDQQAAPPHLLINRDTVQFNLASNACLDVAQFAQLLQPHTPSAPDPENLKAALALYQGEFLEGFAPPDSIAFDEWLTLKRAELHRQFIEALSALCDHFEAQGDYKQALGYAKHLVLAEPWLEQAQRQMMRLLARSGEPSAALRQYENYRQQLERELGVPPADETQALMRLIQENGSLLQQPGQPKMQEQPPRQIGECPYRGLSAFREQDAPFFFGRAAYVEKLLQTLEQQVLVVVVVGPSGSGKSSVIYAGLLPHLRQDQNWLVVAFRPGARPFQALAAALIPLLEPGLSETDRLIDAQKLGEALQQEQVPLQGVLERILQLNPETQHLLLFADQFEELYTLCPDEKLQQQVLDVLLHTAYAGQSPRRAPIKILLTLRADFMGQALSYRPFTDALQEAAQLLGPMSREELRAAVENPAAIQGASFETGLVERILEDVGEKPGSLPLLEFALTLLWEEAEEGVLTHSAYEKLGGVEGSLTRYAEQVYRTLPAPDQAATRTIFLQLVQPGWNTDDTRRVAQRQELSAQHWSLVHHLADKRLVVTNRSADGTETVEIIHEALIQHWDRLKAWLETDRAFRVWQETLRASIRQWQAAGEDESGLLRGVPLAQAENWLGERGPALGDQEIQYIQASLLQRTRAEQQRALQQQEELAKAQAMAATERRARRILSALAGVLAIAVLVTVALTAFANQQRRQALQAYSQSLSASAQQALDDQDSGTALALALAANRIDDPPQSARRILMDAAFAPGARSRSSIETVFPGGAGPATSLGINPTGDQVLLGLSGGELVLWEPRSGEYQLLPGHTARVNAVAIAPDGLTALSGGDDHQVILWDLQRGAEIRRLGGEQGGHSGVVRTVAFSPNGRLALSGGWAGAAITNPGELILWDLSSGQEVRRFTDHLNGVVTARFTPDGEQVLSSSGDMEVLIDKEQVEGQTATNDLLLWDVTSGATITRFDQLDHDISALAISPDGTRALLASWYNNVISLVDLASGERLVTLEGHLNAVRDVAFLPDGQQALSAADDSSLILWDLPGRKPLVILRAGESSQLALAVQPDGRGAFSVTRGGDLFQWDLQDAAVLQRFGQQVEMIFDVAFTPDGVAVLSCAGSPAPDVPAVDASLRLWELESGRLLQAMTPPVQVNYQCAVSPDGSRALSVGEDGLVRLWDLATGQEIQQLPGHSDWAISVAFAPDGQKALSGSKDGTLIYWDLERGLPLHQMSATPLNNWALVISPDGKTALSDDGPYGTAYWDLATGQLIRHLARSDNPEKNGISGVAFLPDGKTAVTGEGDGTLIQWDLATGKEIRRFGRHDDIRTRVEIRADGNIMLTSGMNGALRLWDLASGELIREFGYTAPAVVFDIAISPDGLTAVSGSLDQRLTLWSLQNPTLAELLSWVDTNRAVRELSCAERGRYQIEPLCEEN